MTGAHAGTGVSVKVLVEENPGRANEERHANRGLNGTRYGL
jgi:hypothetical protein